MPPPVENLTPFEIFSSLLHLYNVKSIEILDSLFRLSKLLNFN